MSYAEAGGGIVQKAKLVSGLAPVVPSSATPDYVNMSIYHKLSVIIHVKNATTVTGSAITLKQAKDAAGTDEKALAFDTVYSCLDCAASDTINKVDVTSNTFTTLSTNSKDAVYVIEVNAKELDVSNGFKFVRAGVGNATAATISVMYVLQNARYGGPYNKFPSAIV